ncbi:beta-lactamase/transpeptidase-like protein [Nemania abortiva]|nr:beta-lactamase/transpeptidase-like protein [Nemania abortiva]
MQIGGTPGAAIAIIHDGALIHSEYIGYRDTSAQKLLIDEETIFPCASLTKAVVSAAVADCIENGKGDGKFGWDTPVREILPEFHTKSETLRESMTIVDCLSHRSGMQNSLYYMGSHNDMIIPIEKSMDFINDLKQVKPFRKNFSYNNLGYEIAGHVLKRLTGESWEDTIRSSVLEPLGMTRTGTEASFGDHENVAKTYQARDDASTIDAIPMMFGGNVVGGPAAAMWSCIKDLVKLYTAFLVSWKDQLESGKSSTPDYPLKQVPFLFSEKIPMNPMPDCKTGYALGWARVQTPGPMGEHGINPGLMRDQKMPDVARGHETTLILYHQGSMIGNLAAVNLIPSTQGAVIVLTNSFALNDAADWLGQLYLEAYLGVNDRNDYVALAEETAGSVLLWHPRLEAELQSKRKPGTTPRVLSEYEGEYYNDAKTMMIKVFVEGVGEKSSLKMAFQGLSTEEFPLKHYQDDIFTWLLQRNEFVERGRYTDYNADYFMIYFEKDVEAGKVDEAVKPITHLTWWHDPEIPSEKFWKVS